MKKADLAGVLISVCCLFFQANGSGGKHRMCVEMADKRTFAGCSGSQITVQAQVRLWLDSNVPKAFCVGVGENMKQGKRQNCVWLRKGCLQGNNYR